MNQATMKVVIVAKTRMGSGACIGAIDFSGQSRRLIAADAEFNETAGMEYEVGDVWQVACRPPDQVIPPHVENIIVGDKRRQPPLDDPLAFVQQHMPPQAGGLEALYEGLIQSTRAGAMYIAERTGVPPYSTAFWAPDQPLRRDDDAKRIRYRYPTEDGGRTLTFVGFQEPLAVIPAGTVLRVSLAHWWRPEEMPEGELRCYVQLSGWFIPEHADHWVMVAPNDIADPAGEALRSEPRLAPAQFASSETAGAPDLDQAVEILNTVFGYDDFWPLQSQIIENILRGQDTLAVMPTGGGKSLCYQLPALMFEGLTVVVSPLISLMQDQVSQLREWGIPAVFLNSTLSYNQYLQTTRRIRKGQVKLLYVAPETLLRPETMLLLEGCGAACLAIDEAHCISSWGHDFRPVYRQLLDVRRRLPEAVCFALTATATPRVRADIKEQLAIADVGQFVASFDRPNLFLEVQPKSDGYGQLLTFLEQHRQQSGIIYCATRRQVDELVIRLESDGWPVLPYHAGLETRVRRHNQRRFSHDDVPIMVATVAFGMGIDKSNVRFIVHYDLPKDLESYYQEIGRSGRDGLRADCLLLFNRSDSLTINRFIDQKEDPIERKAASLRLQAMIEYAETPSCRRQALLPYFDQAYDAESCPMCDNCLAGEQELVDLTIPAQMFLSCVKRTGELFGAGHIVKVLRGSREKRVLKFGHDHLSTYGIGGDYSAKQWSAMAGQFVQQGLLNRELDHGSLKLTQKGQAVLKGQKVLGQAPEVEPARVRAQPEEAEYDQVLFELLRTKRKELADAAGVPPYVIFSDRSLADMAAYFPQSDESFLAMHGVGRHKLEKHAEHFLPLIRAYCRENGLAERPKPRASRKRERVRRSARTIVIGQAYAAGGSVQELAKQQGVKPRTILSHLLKYVQAGHRIPAGDLLELSALPAAKRDQALAAFEEHGPAYLRPVFEALGGAVSYDELHILRLYYIASRDSAEEQVRE
ncbi:MAG TPA: DNA helicase RecQ [Anaerolineae bacterium]|nr:DNA helicase RecQ [Anaerolineae bacterium]